MRYVRTQKIGLILHNARNKLPGFCFYSDLWRITEKQSVRCVPNVPARMRTMPSVPAAVGALFLCSDPTTVLAAMALWHARHGKKRGFPQNNFISLSGSMLLLQNRFLASRKRLLGMTVGGISYTYQAASCCFFASTAIVILSQRSERRICFAVRQSINTIPIVWRITEKQSVPCVPDSVGALFLCSDPTTILATMALWHARHDLFLGFSLLFFFISL